ncbi:MAG: hypothetical protein NVSMB42_24570 [Herpetosiphon sp.]
MTRYVNKAHIARATLEATAYQTRDVSDAMDKAPGVTSTSLCVDGGIVVNDTLMQFQSDILGVPVIRPRVAETTARGAEYAAGTATGFWNNLDELRENWGLSKTWEPRIDDTRRAHLYRQWQRAVERPAIVSNPQKPPAPRRNDAGI